MGRGEDYVMAFWDWFNKLSAEERSAFQERHPEPAGWDGFYRSWRGS
jgi:hypothetical protein